MESSNDIEEDTNFSPCRNMGDWGASKKLGMCCNEDVTGPNNSFMSILSPVYTDILGGQPPASGMSFLLSDMSDNASNAAKALLHLIYARLASEECTSLDPAQAVRRKSGKARSRLQWCRCLEDQGNVSDNSR